MNKWTEFKGWLSQWWQAALIGFVMGLITCQAYTYNNLINDCRILNAFRIAGTAFTCKVMVP